MNYDIDKTPVTYTIENRYAFCSAYTVQSSEDRRDYEINALITATIDYYFALYKVEHDLMHLLQCGTNNIYYCVSKCKKAIRNRVEAFLKTPEHSAIINTADISTSLESISEIIHEAVKYSTLQYIDALIASTKTVDDLFVDDDKLRKVCYGGVALCANQYCNLPPLQMKKILYHATLDTVKAHSNAHELDSIQVCMLAKEYVELAKNSLHILPAILPA